MPLDVGARAGEKALQGIFYGSQGRVSGSIALAKPRRIKAAHRRRRRAASGQSVQRYYDPGIGRFLSVDPVTALDNGDMRYFNRYAYAFSNPYSFTDPDGRCFKPINDLVGGLPCELQQRNLNPAHVAADEATARDAKIVAGFYAAPFVAAAGAATLETALVPTVAFVKVHKKEVANVVLELACAAGFELSCSLSVGRGWRDIPHRRDTGNEHVEVRDRTSRVRDSSTKSKRKSSGDDSEEQSPPRETAVDSAMRAAGPGGNARSLRIEP